MTAESAEATLRDQFESVFSDANYPLRDPFELIPLLPEGPATEFTANGVTIPAIELGTTYGKYQSYPYESVEGLVDDLIDALKQEGDL